MSTITEYILKVKDPVDNFFWINGRADIVLLQWVFPLCSNVGCSCSPWSAFKSLQRVPVCLVSKQLFSDNSFFLNSSSSLGELRHEFPVPELTFKRETVFLSVLSWEDIVTITDHSKPRNSVTLRHFLSRPLLPCAVPYIVMHM